MCAAAVAGPDREAVRAFIERFASTLEEAGFARMPARVYVALLATDAGRLTAAELAELLQVSPAAVSGAMRFLIQIGMARRERQPGSRRDVYRVLDDGWYEALVRRDQQMSRWVYDLEAGIAALGEGTPAGQRMSELVAFIEYLEEEMPELLARWRKRRTELRAKRSRPTVTGGE